MKQWMTSIIVGSLSAIAMMIYFYLVEQFLGKNLLTLLLNIDFIMEIEQPGILFHAFEIALHVLVAVMIVRLYIWLIKVRNATSTNKRMEWAAILSFIAFLTYFPLTMLANVSTPDLSDLAAIFDWFIGHVIFFFILYYGVEKWSN